MPFKDREKQKAYDRARRVALKAKPDVFRDKAREHGARRRALKLQTQAEKVDLKQILRDSKGLCGICKTPLDLFGIDFDHIIPLARGGTHTRDNIQATHSRCNRAKGAKVS